jgi:16S rRNA (uracil1498-N3)-methyltransferase
VDRSAKAHAFVADLDAPELDDDDRHHLARVLRIRPGDAITVSDGHGRWRRCAFGPVLEPVEEIEHDPAPTPELTVAFAVVKGERTEWAVQKLVELGIDRVVPFVGDRSVVRWDPARAEHQHVRLVKVARQAAMQSRRATLPLIEPLGSFDQLTTRAGVALADADGGPPSLALPIIVVGPEGGWSETERNNEIPRVKLARTVLRAETAAVAAGAVLVALREHLVRPWDGHSAR